MKLRILGLTGWLAFCFLFSASIKLRMAGSLENFFFHWDSPFWMFLDCLLGANLLRLIRNKFRLLSINSESMNRDFLLLVTAIPINAFLMSFFGLIIIEQLMYGKSHTLYNWVGEFLVEIILQSIVGLSCIAYFYISTINEIKARLSAAQLAQSETQLKILQQKVDPHFLFNNLNVLSSLIEKNPARAGEFLDKLAQLYRYILHTQNADLVSLKEELEFARNYSYLLEQRFGSAYNFEWQFTEAERDRQLMIVPTALQSLLENVIKHNAGSRQIPLRIFIELNDDSLIVKNDVAPKLNQSQPSGTGLQNLSARYAFLTEEQIEISPGEKVFSVKIPLLKTKIEISPIKKTFLLKLSRLEIKNESHHY